MKIVGSLIACILFFSHAVSQSNFSLPLKVTITSGTIEGNYNTKDNLKEFFGIPYAKPPMGAWRWKAPQPIENWKEVRKQKNSGHVLYNHLFFLIWNSDQMTYLKIASI